MISHLFLCTVQIKELTDSVIISNTEILTRDDIFTIKILNSMKKVQIQEGILKIGNSCFEGLSKIAQLNLPVSLTEIGQYSFNGCSSLTSIDFSPNINLIKIGQNAFYGANLAGPLTVPLNIESIGNYAFYITKITSIAFTNVKRCQIGQFAFSGIQTLTGTLTMDTQLTLLRYGFFASQISKVLLGSQVSCQNNPFATCPLATIEFIDPNTPSPYLQIINNVLYDVDVKMLHTYPPRMETTYEAPDTLLDLGPDACRQTKTTKFVLLSVVNIYSMCFSACLLEEVEFRDLKFIDTRAFESTNLVNVVLPNSLTTINAGAFVYCSRLETLNLPKSFTSFTGPPFSGCPKLAITVDPECQVALQVNTTGIIYSNNYTKFIFIPFNLEIIETPLNMTEIAHSTFKGMTKIKKVIFLDNITAIGAESFYSCSSLSEITIPSTLTSIGAYAFNACYQLAKVIFEPNCKLTTLAGFCFLSCGALKVVDFNDVTLSSILESAFSGCGQLETITLPKTLVTIQQNTFSKCVNLQSLTLTSINPVKIDFTAFKGCTKLFKVTVDTVSVSPLCFQNLKSFTILEISQNVKEIGTLGFSGCSNLTNITFQENSKLEYLRTNSFADCISLKEIILPKTILEIDASIFTGCISLIKVEVEDKERFENKLGLLYIKGFSKLVLCPAGLKEAIVDNQTEILGKMSFYGCLNLKLIYLSPSLKNISDFSFFRCESLESLTIPNGINYIGENPFDSCYLLKTIIYCGNDDTNLKTFNDLNPFPEKSIFLVNHLYIKDIFKGKRVLKSSSIDDNNCPNMPSLHFTQKPKVYFKLNPFIFFVLYKLNLDGGKK